MPLYTNDNGTWKEPTPSVNDNGTWKEPSQIYANDNGTWKEVYSSSNPVAFINGEASDTDANIVKRVNTDTMSETHSIEFDTASNAKVIAMDYGLDDYLYVVIRGEAVYKLNTSDLSISTSSSSSDFTPSSSGSDGSIRYGNDGFIYYANFETLYKLDTSLNVVNSNNPNFETIYTLEYGDDDFLYAIMDDNLSFSSQAVHQIDTSSLSTQNEASARSGGEEDRNILWGFDGFIYAIFDDLVRYDTNLNVDSTFSNSGQVLRTTNDVGDYVLAAGRGTDGEGIVQRIDTSTMSPITSYQRNNTSQSDFSDVAVQSDGSIYVGTEDTDGTGKSELIKLDSGLNFVDELIGSFEFEIRFVVTPRSN